MNLKALSIIVVCVFLLNCSRPTLSTTQLPPEKLNLSHEEKNTGKIAFLTLKMTLTDSLQDKYQFTLLNSFFAEGVLKNSLSNGLDIEPYTLYCEITDASERKLDMIKVQNPLQKVFEYSPDKTVLQKKIVADKTGDVYLRFQFTKDSKYLTIYKPQQDLGVLKKIYHAQF